MRIWLLGEACMGCALLAWLIVVIVVGKVALVTVSAVMG